MPIDLSVGNSINAAYAQGRKESFERQQRLDELAQKQKEEEDKAAMLAEQQRQFNEKQAQDQKQFQVEHALRQNLFNLQQTTAAQDFSKFTEQTGNPAQGFSPDLAGSPTDTVEIAPGTFVPRATLYKNDQGVSYTARSPQVAAHQQAQVEDTLKASDRNETRHNMLYQSALADSLSNNASERKNTQEDYINAIENAQKTTARHEDYRHDLDMQLLRNAAILGKAGAAQKDELWDRLPLNPAAQDFFKLPAGSVWSDAIGQANMDAPGKEELLKLIKAEPIIIRVQEELSKQFQDPNTRTVQSGYDRYFQGGIKGTVKDLYNKVVPDPYVNSIKPDLGEFFTAMKEIGNFGSALTKNEAEFMRAYVPGSERTLTPDAARKIVDHSLKSIEQNQIDTVMTHASVKKGSPKQGDTVKISTQTPRFGSSKEVDEWRILPDGQ